MILSPKRHKQKPPLPGAYFCTFTRCLFTFFSFLQIGDHHEDIEDDNYDPEELDGPRDHHKMSNAHQHGEDQFGPVTLDQVVFYIQKDVKDKTHSEN